jgi:hypothetical protein
MGNKLKKPPVLVFWAAGEACFMGGVHFAISISVDGFAGSGLPHTPIVQPETACQRRQRSLTDG